MLRLPPGKVIGGFRFTHGNAKRHTYACNPNSVTNSRNNHHRHPQPPHRCASHAPRSYPAGTFQMGSPNTERERYEDWEGPVHAVTITNDFYIGETEVTQAQWQALMGSNPSSSLGVGNDYPVYYVSWNDITQANGFLDRLDAQTSYSGSRLPFGSGVGVRMPFRTQTRFHFGDSLGCDAGSQDCAAGLLPGNRSDYVWYDWSDGQNGYPGGPKEVATLLPNQFGLYDMSGNLWEWCQDWFQEDFYRQPGATYPNPLCTNSASRSRVVRGGDWNFYAWYCRSAMRMRSRPHAIDWTIGFRVVLPLEAFLSIYLFVLCLFDGVCGGAPSTEKF